MNFKNVPNIEELIKRAGTLSAITEIDTDNPSDEEILRISISAELSAINLYQKLAELTSNIQLRKVLLDIAKEEKVHVAEFETILSMLDKEEVESKIEGEEEINNLLSEV